MLTILKINILKTTNLKFDLRSQTPNRLLLKDLNKLYTNRLLLFTKVAKATLFSSEKKVFKNSVRSF